LVATSNERSRVAANLDLSKETVRNGVELGSGIQSERKGLGCRNQGWQLVA